LTQVVGVDGLEEEGAAFVRRLRLHCDAILAALEGSLPFRVELAFRPGG
jgi:hypothetical protein